MSPRFKVYNIDVTFDPWVTFVFDYNPELGFGYIRPDGGDEGMAGVPILLLEEGYCKTSEIFYGTIRGVLFYDLEWLNFYNFPYFIFQLPDTMRACQTRFLEKLRRVKVPITS